MPRHIYGMYDICIYHTLRPLGQIQQSGRLHIETKNLQKTKGKRRENEREEGERKGTRLHLTSDVVGQSGLACCSSGFYMGLEEVGGAEREGGGECVWSSAGGAATWARIR